RAPAICRWRGDCALSSARRRPERGGNIVVRKGKRAGRVPARTCVEVSPILPEHGVLVVAGGEEISDKIQDFLLREKIQKSLRHRRDFGGLDTFDLFTIDG